VPALLGLGRGREFKFMTHCGGGGVFLRASCAISSSNVSVMEVADAAVRSTLSTLGLHTSRRAKTVGSTRP